MAGVTFSQYCDHSNRATACLGGRPFKVSAVRVFVNNDSQFVMITGTGPHAVYLGNTGSPRMVRCPTGEITTGDFDSWSAVLREHNPADSKMNGVLRFGATSPVDTDAPKKVAKSVTSLFAAEAAPLPSRGGRLSLKDAVDSTDDRFLVGTDAYAAQWESGELCASLEHFAKLTPESAQLFALTMVCVETQHTEVSPAHAALLKEYDRTMDSWIGIWDREASNPPPLARGYAGLATDLATAGYGVWAGEALIRASWLAVLSGDHTKAQEYATRAGQAYSAADTGTSWTQRPMNEGFAHARAYANQLRQWIGEV